MCNKTKLLRLSIGTIDIKDMTPWPMFSLLRLIVLVRIISSTLGMRRYISFLTTTEGAKWIYKCKQSPNQCLYRSSILYLMIEATHDSRLIPTPSKLMMETCSYEATHHLKPSRQACEISILNIIYNRLWDYLWPHRLSKFHMFTTMGGCLVGSDNPVRKFSPWSRESSEWDILRIQICGFTMRNGLHELPSWVISLSE